MTEEVKAAEPSYWPTYPGFCQMSHQTKANRFPKIFERAKQLQPDAKRILSFGCSTGQEAFTLAEHFPKAEIVGVDLDYYSVNAARKANQEKDRIFFHTDLGATGYYDLITCFMVLFALDKPVPRDRWDEAVTTMDRHLSPNGVLMIYTSEYDFSSSELSKGYNVISSWTRIHDKNKKEYFNGYYRKIIRNYDI